MSWLQEAQADIGQWAPVMPKDADGNPIDWQWIASLDLESGIGSGIPTTGHGDAQAVHDALKADYAVRDRVEAIIAQCSTAFMTDFDRLVASYRLPRALAHANRRLNDEINALLELGERMRIWQTSHERQGRATVVVLKPYGEEKAVRLDDIRDRTAEILNARAKRRKEQRRQQRSGAESISRANLSGATTPGGSAARAADASASVAGKPYPQPDWRDAYLPGRDVDTVMGIDIETTGTDPARDYIIDVGFEYMNMVSPRPADQPAGYQYEQHYYDAGDAWGQSRLGFAVTDANARRGNPFIAKLTGIDVRTRTVAAGYRLFDEWPEAQSGLLARLTAQPYVAHNATFEHGWFMLNVAGYAEAYRAGDITIIDTMPMSRQWDPGSAPSDGHPYGDNTLDSYAKRQGALDPSRHERHLGLEDTHIMLVAMKHHLAALKAAGRGPWGAHGRSGVGGKTCGRKW